MTEADKTFPKASPLPADAPPPSGNQDAFTRLGEDLSWSEYMAAVLKTPMKLFTEIRNGNCQRATLSLLVATAACLVLYGVVAGMVSGGLQILVAPVKVLSMVVLSGILCFPSLYIFTSLSNVDVRPQHLLAYAVSGMALTSLLLVGLVPVLFVFTVSTESFGFIGVMHLAIWWAAGYAGHKLLMRHLTYLRGGGSKYLGVWMLIFTLVLCQMSTTLRPILGDADTLLTSDKKFFLLHWLESLAP